MKNEKGFALIQVVVAAGIFSIIALAMSHLIAEQSRSTAYLEDQLEKIQLIRTFETILQDGVSCQNTLQGMTMLPSGNTINVPDLKDNSGNSVFQSNSEADHLEIGQITLSNSSVPGPSSNGFVDITIPLSRIRQGGGSNTLNPYTTKLQISVDSTNTISSCSMPDPHFLGGGTMHMNGVGNVICKPINFIGGHSEPEVLLIGNLYYPPGSSGAWGQWSVYFRSVNYTDGTGTICIDSGGFSGTINSEWVKWIAYKM